MDAHTELLRLTEGRPYYRQGVDSGWLGLYMLGHYDGTDGSDPRSTHPEYLAGFTNGQRERRVWGNE